MGGYKHYETTNRGHQAEFQVKCKDVEMNIKMLVAQESVKVLIVTSENLYSALIVTPNSDWHRSTM